MKHKWYSKHSRSSGERDGTLWNAFKSWRTTAVSLLSFSSGLPLGLVWIAIPDWMRQNDVDLRLVGMMTLAQAPWSFKVLWSPLMDRFTPLGMGRRRGWTLLAQLGLLALTLGMAGLGGNPDTPWILFSLALAMALVSATQDIAIDAYAVDVLRKEEQGIAVGARTALYRAAMFVAGGLTITLTGRFSWPLVCCGLAVLYLPMMLVAWKAPEPETPIVPPASLREAVWQPFLEFLTRYQALSILAFVLLYKLSDNLAQSLLRPFLRDMGYDAFHRGVALATLGILFTLTGTFLGGALTEKLGLGPSLWLFGFLQIFSNVGYILLASGPVNIPLMYGAMGFENLTTGLGMGAFSVLLLRMTRKRFSATQYALFSSLFGLPRILAGPISGYTVHAVGWKMFFWFTMAAGIPGLILLARFVPFGVREPAFTVRAPSTGRKATPARLLAGGAIGLAAGLAAGWTVLASLDGLEQAAAGTTAGFHFGAAFLDVLNPASAPDWLALVGTGAFALICGLFAAAVIQARGGAVPEQPELGS